MINNADIPTRRQAVASALASVRAAGLEPSRATVKCMQRYAKGKTTSRQMQQQTFREVMSHIR